MTDDSDAERGALASCFPGSTLLLCQFHVQQAMWRWLWDSKHQIKKEHRKKLMIRFRAIVNSETLQSYEEAVENLKENSTAANYKGFLK